MTLIRQATPPRSGTNLASNKKHFRGSPSFDFSSITVSSSTSGSGGGSTRSMVLSNTFSTPVPSLADIYRRSSSGKSSSSTSYSSVSGMSAAGSSILLMTGMMLSEASKAWKKFERVCA